MALFAIGANLVGSFTKANAASQSAEFNAQTLESNAQIADTAASDAILRGRIMEGHVLTQGAVVGSSQRSTAAASGADVKSGSAINDQVSTASQGALAALTARSNATRDAWGYATKATQFRRQAAITRATGKTQATADILGGVLGSAKMALPFLTVSGQGTPDYVGDGSYGGGDHPDEAD